jgi:uncharacterized protein
MPEVIANTSPLQYLYQISRLDFLPRLYQRVIVPETVADELRRGGDQGIAVPDVDVLPWVTIASPNQRTLRAVSEALGPGERAVIALALESPGALVILDDREARQFAETLDVRCTGTLGVVARAKEEGWIAALRPLVDQLVQSGFFLDPTTRAKVLKLVGETP